MAAPSVELLWPRPKKARVGGDWLELARAPRIAPESANPALRPPAERLAEALAATGRQPRIEPGTGGAVVSLALRPEAGLRAQGYRLSIGQAGVELQGADEAGLGHGVSTLVQWLRLHALRDEPGAPVRRLAGVEVEDWPDFAVRGVLLDVSRDKVPTMATLRRLVDLLADWKYNQLQLYTEHTFAYRGHERVWRDASPITAAEATELDGWCARRGIELVPNQNSFGHLHRWLRHEPYRRLAECPEGVEHPFGEEREPFSLCPVDPGSLELLADLYDQLLPQFASRLANVGLDETFDLGRGRSAAACAERGRGRVYLEFLQAIHRLLAARGHRMQFWADGLLEHPELIAEVPGDAIPLVWGYEAGHPFAEQSAPLAAAGLELYLCPGTSSWNSLAGRTANALLDLSQAAIEGREVGATGYLVTDWGDNGHLQPLPVSYPGLLAGAGFAWNAESAADALALPLADLLDHHAWPAPGLGAAALALGNAYLATGAELRNGTVLFRLLLDAAQTLEHARFSDLTPDGLHRALAVIDQTTETLASPRPPDRDGASEGALAAREYRWVAALLALACRLGLARLEAGRDQSLSALPRRTRRAVRRALLPLIEEHRTVWLARNRPGGRRDSVARLHRLATLLR